MRSAPSDVAHVYASQVNRCAAEAPAAPKSEIAAAIETVLPARSEVVDDLFAQMQDDGAAVRVHAVPERA